MSRYWFFVFAELHCEQEIWQKLNSSQGHTLCVSRPAACPDVGPTLVQRLRRWPSIGPTCGQRLVFAGWLLWPIVVPHNATANLVCLHRELLQDNDGLWFLDIPFSKSARDFASLFCFQGFKIEFHLFKPISSLICLRIKTNQFLTTFQTIRCCHWIVLCDR